MLKRNYKNENIPSKDKNSDITPNVRFRDWVSSPSMALK